MKIINTVGVEKEKISGKLSIRFIPSRAVYQLYCGGRYVYGCAGENDEEILEQFHSLYDHVPTAMQMLEG
jgi:hypothetical protein